MPGQAWKTEHWFYGLFQSARDLLSLLPPAAGAAGASAGLSLGQDSSGDALYRYSFAEPLRLLALELKAANHLLDGALWPRGSESGTPEQPVVLLEEQMQGKAGFKHRLFAQNARFLQLHPQVLPLAVVLVMPHRRLNLGPRLAAAAAAELLRWCGLAELGGPGGLRCVGGGLPAGGL